MVKKELKEAQEWFQCTFRPLSSEEVMLRVELIHFQSMEGRSRAMLLSSRLLLDTIAITALWSLPRFLLVRLDRSQ